MRQVKITNYTTRDWLKQLGAIACFLALGRMFIERLVTANYLAALGWLLGAAGWFIIYLHIMKGIEKKNPQE